MISSRVRLQKACRRLALAPIRRSKALHRCCFCANDIRPGDDYRDRDAGLRAHSFCFEAVNREVNRGS